MHDSLKLPIKTICGIVNVVTMNIPAALYFLDYSSSTFQD